MDSMNTPIRQRKLTPLEAEIERGKKMRKEHYLQQARSHIALAEIYLTDTTGKYGEKDILCACEKAVDYMDAFLRESYSVNDLLTTYVDGYKASIEVLLCVKTNDAIQLGIDLSERLGRSILAEKSDVNKNAAILEIALLQGALRSSQYDHKSAIDSYELAERIRKIQLRTNAVENADALLAECYLLLTVEHIESYSLEHYESAMDCYLKAINLYAKGICNTRIKSDIDDILSIKHVFARVFGQFPNARKHIFVDDHPFCGNDMPQICKLLIDSDFDDLKKQAKILLSRGKSITLTECVAALKTYERVLSRVLRNIECSEEENYLLKMKKNCFTLISDLLLENGDFYESKKYSDLASSTFSENI